jgi:YVTN family beta-propeller protein
MRRRWLLLAGAAALGALVAGPEGLRAQSRRQPVYVGAQVCARCHEGRAAGNQHSLWLRSAHSKAWASLATVEARQMARLSGIPEDPEKAPICLGCHATAADAETWERDAGFHVEDGVQCEKCHGPGSEYADADVMRDREAAMMAGLRQPTKRDCEMCHYVKGSHVAVHKKPQLDIDAGWKALAHPVPAEGKGRELAMAAPPAAEGPGPKHVGSLACGTCHQGPMMGYQLSLWRMGPHARAYASLSTERADELARRWASAATPRPRPSACAATRPGDGPAAATFSHMEGVGCEACHGPGSDYMAEAVMRDRPTAMKAGLRPVTEKTCASCHANAHGKPFRYAEAKATIAHPTRPGAERLTLGRRSALAAGTGQERDVEQGTMTEGRAEALLEHFELRYKNPVNLEFRPDGREVWVACEAGGSVAVVDVATRRWWRRSRSGGQATDVAFSPDGETAYVTARLDDAVAVVDVATRRLVRTIPVADEPHGIAVSPDGRNLFVMGTAHDAVSVVDVGEGRETRRLVASRNPWSKALSPDGRRLLVTNALSRFVPFRAPPASEITVIDVAGRRVETRWVVPESNLLLGVDWHPSGEFALATLNRTKNLVPMTRILQGWTITNGLALLWPDGRVDQVLLDEPHHYFADVTDVAFAPDGKKAFATSAGTDRLAVIDVERLLALVRRTPDEERREVLPNWLGASAEFVVARVPTRDNPRGVAVAPDGATAWVANTLDDSLSVIDVALHQEVARVDLGGPRHVTHIRRGEKLFHSANITFQRQFACATCHPDGHVDGLTYDIEADGIGVNPVDNRTLRGIYDTDPFKWAGTNPSLARQCGARLAVFFTRVAPFTPRSCGRSTTSR